MTTCSTGITYGWGAAAWGTTGWGGYGIPTFGGTIPTMPPFDLYCLCSGYVMERATSYDEVAITPYDHFTVDLVNHDVIAFSADSVEAQFFVNVAIMQSYTLEFSLTFLDLPDSFVDADRKIYVGAVNENGYSAGLMFSKVGLAYLGNPNTAFQVLPDSDSLVAEDTLYVGRIVVNAITQAVFIYFSTAEEASKYGPQLRYIMPLIPYSGSIPAQEGTHVRALGTTAYPSRVALDSLCLSSQTLSANVPPVADAGTDQAVRNCAIIQLDGSKSFDPEGAPIIYQWRLIDGPVGSTFVFEGLDGATTPLSPPTGYTDKLYSSSFGGSSPIPIAVADVLYIEGSAYDIIEVGTDRVGYFVRIQRHLLPDSWTGQPYKILKQHGLKDTTTVKPTFYPDLVGFWRFDLIVYDGSLYSAPSVTVVNVLQSMLPRGIIPDAKFFWNTLSDFWKLVEDPERIEVLWSAFIQIIATELYTLWQTEYCKSIRDIQKTFTRRWLHYDLLLREPFIDLVQTRVPMRGIDSVPMSSAGLMLGGKSLRLILPDETVIPITITGFGLVTPENLAKQIRDVLATADSRFDCQVVDQLSGPGTSVVRILAPFQFDILSCDSPIPFSGSSANQPLVGTNGQILNARVYRLPVCASGLIKEDDVLVTTDTLTGAMVMARISAVGDSYTDDHRFQRLLLKDDLPLSAGTDWFIPFRSTSPQLNFYRGLVTENDIAVVETIDNDFNDIVYHDVNCFGSHPSLPNSVIFFWDNLPLFLASPARYNVFFWGVYRRGYMPIESNIVDIPHLQRVINGPDEEEVLRRNVDYFIDTFRDQQCVQFVQSIWDPDGHRYLLPRLWAEYNYLDNSDNIEANFGIPVDFTIDDWKKLPNTVDYLYAVRGLWYAYTNGPTLRNLRIGAQILLGLPFAEEAGTIVEIRSDFSPNYGRLLIQDTDNPEVIRSYPYPRVLELEENPLTKKPYVEGDVVAQFAPLVTGVEVDDYVKTPDWFKGMMSQGVLREVEKYNKFLVKIDGDVFNLSALVFSKEFIKKIKPTYTHPIFVVTKGREEVEAIDVTDAVSRTGYLHLESGALWRVPSDSSTGADDPDPSPGHLETPGVHLRINPFDTTVPSPYTDMYGSQGNFSSHYMTAADTGDDRTQPLPISPNSDLFCPLGDQGPLSPEMAIVAVQSANLSDCPFPDHVAGHMVADSMYRADAGLYQQSYPILMFGQQFLLRVNDSWQVLGEPQTVTGDFVFSTMEIEIHGKPIPDSVEFEIGVFINDVITTTVAFTHDGGGQYAINDIMLDTVSSDVVTLKIRGAEKSRPYWYAITVSLSTIDPVGWADAGDTGPWPGGPTMDPLPEGSIQLPRTL